MKKLAFIFTLIIVGLHPNFLIAQSDTEFWFAPPNVTDNHGPPFAPGQTIPPYGPGGVPIYLLISSMGQPAVVTISQPANPGFNGGTPVVVNIGANKSARVDLSAFKTALETQPTNTVLNTGLHIVSTTPVTAYYEVATFLNSDIFSLKGSNAEGNEFYIPLNNHASFLNAGGGVWADKAIASFDIVATQDSTTVTITSPVNVDGHPALTPFTVLLQKGQTYSCGYTGAGYELPANHPSGAHVTADKPVAITMKDDSDRNPSGSCADLVGDQLVPVSVIGDEYIAVKGLMKSNGDESVIIIATQNNTNIYINGSASPITTLSQGQYYRVDMDYLVSSIDNSIYIKASHPVYATHVTGMGCEMSQTLLPKINCTGSSQVNFVRSTKEAFYLTLLVRSNAVNGFSITGSGNATINPSDFKTVPGSGGNWKAARIYYNTTNIPVDSVFSVSNSQGLFALGILNGDTAGSSCRYGYFSDFGGLTLNPKQLEVKCYGGNSGAAGVFPVGGGSSYTYQWQLADGTPTGSGHILGDLAAGKYIITVTSNYGCVAKDTFSISQPQRPLDAIGGVQSHVSCYGRYDGVAQVNSSGGTPPYTYSWSSSIEHTASTVSGLPQGTYYVLVTDTNGCTKKDTVVVTQPTILKTDTIIHSTVNCFNGNNGAIAITNSGGTPGYNYSWSSSPNDTLSSVMGLIAGTYSVQIKDHNGCTKSHTISISQPLLLTTETSIQSNVNCFNNSNGAASTLPQGGVTPYHYSWSSGINDTLANITGLVANTYTVTIKDANGCIKIDSVRITQPSSALISAVANKTNVKCYNERNGSVDIQINGGTAPYHYTWSDGQTTQNVSNLTPGTHNISTIDKGTYQLLITDHQGCTSTQTMTISQPDSLRLPSSKTDLICFGLANGRAVVTPAGGNGGYTYSWTQLAKTDSIANDLTAGTYTITCSDQLGCSQSTVITITQPSKVKFDAVVSNKQAICNHQEAILSAIASGGTGTNYNYLWTPGNINSSIITVSPSTTTSYTVVATDENGCTSDQSMITLTVNALPTVGFTSNVDKGCGATCVDFTNQSTDAAGISWNFGDGHSSDNTSPSHCFTQTGSYTVKLIVTDVNGCADSVTKSAAMTIYDVPHASFTASPDYLPQDEPVCINNSSTGATSWHWDFGDETTSSLEAPCHTYEDTSFYAIRLIVISADGCRDSALQYVRVAEKLTIDYPNIFTPNGDGVNDVFSIPSTGLKTLECIIYDRWGLQMYEWNSPTGGWDGKMANGLTASDGTYYFILKAITSFSKETINKQGFFQLKQ